MISALRARKRIKQDPREKEGWGADGIWQSWNHQLSSKRRGHDETQLFNLERRESTRCKCLLPGRPGPAMVQRDHSKHTFEGI